LKFILIESVAGFWGVQTGGDVYTEFCLSEDAAYEYLKTYNIDINNDTEWRIEKWDKLYVAIFWVEFF